MLLLVSAAVAVMKLPMATAVEGVNVKFATQLALVVTVIAPIKLCPSPKPVGSAAALEKN